MSDPLISTLADLPFHFSGRFPKPALMRHCRADGVQAWASRELFDQIRDISLGLTGLGIQPGDRVAIMAESRPAWTMADLAILTARAVSVPIYSTLPAVQVRFILADSGARAVVVSDAAQAQKIRGVRADLPELQSLIVMDAPETGPGEVSLTDVERDGHKRLMVEHGLGRVYREQTAAVRPGDVATLIYTSGTTGTPKGVMLTHGNIVSNIVDVDAVIEVNDEDEALSFLPLSHAFERLVMYLYLYKGVTVSFAESIETVSRDLTRVRPTIMTGVPRVYEKLHARVLENVAQSPAIGRVIFAWALGVGRRRARARLAGREPSAALRLQDRLADCVVFSKIRARTGGRLRFAVSGSAPLAPAVAEFLFAIGLPVIEGYGLTEASPVLTVNPMRTPRLGTVGKALPRVELRIAEDGEIVVRGPNVMMGYYHQPEATAEVVRDGWLYTGDIGRIDPDGYLTITDRKKALLKTAGGKYVAPQPIEALLKRDPLVAEAMLIGERRRFVSVVLVPSFALLESRARTLGVGASGRDELVQNPSILKLFQTVVDSVNRELAPFEQIKRFVLLPAEFSIESGELTPTLKVKRRVVEEKWGKAIEGMYQ